MDQDFSAHMRRFADLCAGRVPYLHVRGFLDQTVASNLADQVSTQEPLAEYRTVPGMGKIGFALAEVTDKETLTEYLRWGQRFDKTMDGLLSPDPFQKINALIERLWPAGLTRASLRGHAFPTGIARRHQSGWHGESVHIDCPPALIIDQAGQADVLQLGVVCYASACEVGGSLHIWSELVLDENAYRTRCNAAGVERLDAYHLGEPSVRIEPQPGDLVIFRTAHPHAVTTIEKGRRVSFGFFLGATGPDQPLLAWA
ncbi:hypothetical protein B5P46_01660 [Rhizobium leguminosarum]|uniref:Uncharacterized protein n=1 Tax=Rhizobium leguminosarum TaxID=384 RepID=A0A4Q1UCW0_RHILE|nr:2OG-Fe(II) oxygenase [Rhizobium leguminosarum]RXT29806.1 hypothetical protein B5P46_01660 [Rhizobium leguminosarum]